MSKIMNFKETHYSVRQKIGDAGSISTQNINPLHSVTPKPPESQYGATYLFLAENPVFQFFSPIGPLSLFVFAVFSLDQMIGWSTCLDRISKPFVDASKCKKHKNIVWGLAPGIGVL